MLAHNSRPEEPSLRKYPQLIEAPFLDGLGQKELPSKAPEPRSPSELGPFYLLRFGY